LLLPLFSDSIVVTLFLCLSYLSGGLLCPERPSWSWSYGSWIYNYICNQCFYHH